MYISKNLAISYIKYMQKFFKNIVYRFIGFNKNLHLYCFALSTNSEAFRVFARKCGKRNVRKFVAENPRKTNFCLFLPEVVVVCETVQVD